MCRRIGNNGIFDEYGVAKNLFLLKECNKDIANHVAKTFPLPLG